MKTLMAATLVALYSTAAPAQSGKFSAPWDPPPPRPRVVSPASPVVPQTRVVPITGEKDAPAGPAVSIRLHDRHGQGTPHHEGFTHTGGGTIDVAQPSADTVIITMTGAAVAGGHPYKNSVAALDFDFEQCLEVAVDEHGDNKMNLTLEARVVGLLRSHAKGGGTATETGGCATVTLGPAELATVCAPAHSVSCGESLSINDRCGPVSIIVAPGKLILHQKFHVRVAHPSSIFLCKAASAEFAPDPALDPLWISSSESFLGAQKKDFGFQVTLRVAPSPPLVGEVMVPAK